MKKGILIAFICALSFSSFAQDGYSLTFFRNIPIGAYASTDVDEGGFAEPGWGMALEVNSRIKTWPKGLTVGFRIGFHHNDLNTSQMENSFENAIERDGITVEVRDAAYRPLLVTMGPHYQFYLSPLLRLNLKSGIGLIFTNLDPVRIDVFSSGGLIVLEEDFYFEGVPNFTYLLGASLDFMVGERGKISLNVDHSYANEKINYENRQIGESSSRQKIAFINLGIGFGLSF